MKIAIWHNLPSGGGMRAMVDHVRGLVARGHAVEVWCPPTADRRFLPLAGLCPEHVLALPGAEERGWLPRKNGPLGPYDEMVARLGAMDAHTRACAAQIEQGGFDVVYAHPCTFFRVTALARWLTLPTICYVAEPYRWLYEAMPSLPWAALPPPEGPWWHPATLARFRDDFLKTQSLRLQAREELVSARAYSLRLVNSYYSRESLLRAYGLDSSVCSLGIDTERYRDLRLPRENRVVGVGAFVPEKNIGLVIDAVARLPEKRRPVLCWIGNVAFAPYLDELTRRAAESGVVFEPLQRIPDTEVVRELNRASAFVYAPRLEPFGLAPLEAGACRTPVVGVAEAGVRETVRPGVNGILADHDPDALASAIDTLLCDPATARTLGEGGRRLVETEFSPEAALDRLEGFLRKATGKPLRSAHPAAPRPRPEPGPTRLLAFYLPQYHPVSENDSWWGPGFTEWTNVSQGRALFAGHTQPHVPGELGFYDLRLSSVRQAQASLAHSFGIGGFCYYHYWFSGRRLLEGPFSWVLSSGEPDFPFCLCWANETWSRRWDGREEEVLIAQTYGGDDDDRAHFACLLPAFQDPRYVRVDGRPLFLVYRPFDLPDARRTTDLWRAEAKKAGLPGLYLVAVRTSFAPNPGGIPEGFDAEVVFQPQGHLLYAMPTQTEAGSPSPPATPEAGGALREAIRRSPALTRLWFALRGRRRAMPAAPPAPAPTVGAPHRLDYGQVAATMRARMAQEIVPDGDRLRFPTVLARWDNTPRRGERGLALTGDDPSAYGAWLRDAVEAVAANPPDQRLVFVNAWNEWGEGAHLEPDRRWGRAYLEATRQALREAAEATRQALREAAEEEPAAKEPSP